MAGVDNFKAQGVQLSLGGARRAGGPALGPQNGGLAIVQGPASVAAPAGAAPVFSVSPVATQPHGQAPQAQVAPLGGSKIPSMRKSQAGGGARDAFTPAGRSAQIQLAQPRNQPQLAGGAPAELQQPELSQRPPAAPELAGNAGAENVVRCEAVAEMPDGQRYVAPYDAVFPAGAKFLGVRIKEA